MSALDRQANWRPTAKRLAACLAGSLVLAMMIGPQEGTQADWGYAFSQSVLRPRVFLFLAIGVLIFLAVTYRPKVLPYLSRPGVWPLVSGVLAVVAAQVLMHWDDSVGNAKFGAVADAAANAPGLAPISAAFFGWLAWTQLVVLAVAGAVAIVLAQRWLAWAVTGLSVVAAVVCFLAHRDFVQLAGGTDHSLGYAAAMLGYLVIASAQVACAVSTLQVAQSKAFVARITGFRPGLPLVAVGLVATILAFTFATWFSPNNYDATLSDTHRLFEGTGLAPIAAQYLSWLGWVIFVGALALGVAGCWWRREWLGWLATVVGALGTALTLMTLYDISALGARRGVDSSTGPWQNLGSGGWLACIGLFLLGAGGFVAATSARSARRRPTAALVVVDSDAPSAGSFLSGAGAARSALLVAVAVALFYPPMATPAWQQVLVTSIGTSILLAAGLNVVVGWAGLLDLGFIAFYAIGSYTTAYLVGKLPVQPPSWLHLSPLLAIPFAIAICLLAGLVLGAPTLRLRGDYLAIVTLGFGEIIHLVAVNADGITNGSQGPSGLPTPDIHLGPLHLQWGLNQLQYWYLLLVIMLVIVIAFRRLEGSRLGRSWAAVREDEVAAQATGLNTTRVKLLAFAIGASTSGVAGVFFATQIGSFTPDNFVLNNSILIVAYVVFGGMGSLSGAMAGAALLTWLPEFLKDQVPPADRLMWIGAVVLLMMIFRPAGLMPARRRKAELSGLQRTSSAETTAVPAGEGL